MLDLVHSISLSLKVRLQIVNTKFMNGDKGESHLSPTLLSQVTLILLYSLVSFLYLYRNYRGLRSDYLLGLLFNTENGELSDFTRVCQF